MPDLHGLRALRARRLPEDGHLPHRRGHPAVLLLRGVPVTVAGSDDLGDLLTASLRGCVYPVDLVGVREHLLPVVTAWADARARERAAEAWDEGYDAGYLHVPPHHAVNPYRADALAADDRTGQR